MTVSKLNNLIRSAGEKSKNAGIYNLSQGVFDIVLLNRRKSGSLKIFTSFLNIFKSLEKFETLNLFLFLKITSLLIEPVQNEAKIKF